MPSARVLRGTVRPGFRCAAHDDTPGSRPESIRQVPQPRHPKKRPEPPDHGWVISFGCKPTGKLRRLKVDADSAADTGRSKSCPCGEVHHVTVPRTSAGATTEKAIECMEMIWAMRRRVERKPRVTAWVDRSQLGDFLVTP